MSGVPRPSALTGTRPLLRVTLRQDAHLTAPWIVLISVLSASSILAYAWVFPDEQDRRALAGSLGVNPALSLVFGPARDLLSADGFNAWRAGQLGAFFAGLMAILVVVRNSRANEDSGQAELIASGVIARRSRLAVALLIAAIAAVVLGVLCAVLTIAVGGSVVASILLAATFTASALMFGAVAAVCAQVASEARTATSLAVAILGISYVVRGYLDASDLPDWTTWLTPLGWLERTAPATEQDPWPLLLALGLTAVLVALAFVLQERRDFGQGVVPSRPGPARAGLARSAWGLALALHSGSLVAWLIAFAGLGLLFGSLAGSIGDLVADNPAVGAVLAAGGAANPAFAFLTTILQVIAIIAAVLGVQVVLHLHAEEVAHRVEPLLATSLRRPVHLASNAVLAFGATAVAMALAGTTLGLVASRQESSVAMGDVLRQAVATIPAVWVLVALALAVVGVAPGQRVIGWLGVVATFVLTILGPTFHLWDWLLDLSPLRHVPDVTSPAPRWGELAWLALVAASLTAVGFAGYRRRDIG